MCIHIYWHIFLQMPHFILKTFKLSALVMLQGSEFGLVGIFDLIPLGQIITG